MSNIKGKELFINKELNLKRTNWYVGDFKIDSLFLAADTIEVISVRDRTDNSL